MKAILTHNIEKYVTAAYKADYPCISKWHIVAGSGLDACVARTVSDFAGMQTLKFYVVKENGKFVGYFGSEFEGEYMPTIYIHPSYRGRKEEFWHVLKSKMADHWKAGIYAKNIPCLRFYAKRGTQVVDCDSEHGRIVVFEFSKDKEEVSPCH